ncbi:MAG: SagB/ThcOx family dehydrogenase [Candidatus Thorarchaeota archaeon]
MNWYNMSGYGDDFFEKSKYERGNLPEHRLDWATRPPALKTYPDAARISLPPPDTSDGLGFWAALQRRRSVRAFTDEEITRADLSQLIWATQGVTAEVSTDIVEYKLRPAPSAGALYPIETYLCINRVSGVNPGLYHYNVAEHELELLEEGDFSSPVGAGTDQQVVTKAAVVFIWSAIVQRSKWKYLQRSYRYIFLDAGHIAQNLALAAESLELGSCQIGFFYDKELNDILDLDGSEESVIYLSAVGTPRRPHR